MTTWQRQKGWGQLVRTPSITIKIMVFTELESYEGVAYRIQRVPEHIAKYDTLFEIVKQSSIRLIHKFSTTGSIARQPLLMADQACNCWVFFISNKFNSRIFNMEYEYL